jgi:hypothetical protein
MKFYLPGETLWAIWGYKQVKKIERKVIIMDDYPHHEDVRQRLRDLAFHNQFHFRPNIPMPHRPGEPEIQGFPSNRGYGTICVVCDRCGRNGHVTSSCSTPVSQLTYQQQAIDKIRSMR